MPDLKEKSVALLVTVAGIDATAVAATTLYAVPTGKALVVDHVVIRVTSFTAGAKDTQATASFGGNDATYDDYLNSVVYTIDTLDEFIKDSVEDAATPIYAAAANLKISIEVASNADVEVWSVDVFGYLIDA